MQVKPVDVDDIDIYMPYMTNEEIHGCFSGRFTVMGCREESHDEPAGFCVLEVLPEYVQIQRIFVNEGENREVILGQLLEKIKDMPESDRLPIYIFGGQMGEKIKKLGFEKCDNHYYYEIAKLSDMKELHVKRIPGMSVVFAEDVPEKILTELHRAGTDYFFQFPYAEFDLESFGGSLVCLINGRITAYLLLEDNDKFVRIRKVYGKDPESLDACFFVLRNTLAENYPSDVRLVFFSAPKSSNWERGRYFHNMKKIPIQTMKLV